MFVVCRAEASDRLWFRDESVSSGVDMSLADLVAAIDISTWDGLELLVLNVPSSAAMCSFIQRHCTSTGLKVVGWSTGSGSTAGKQTIMVCACGLGSVAIGDHAHGIGWCTQLSSRTLSVTVDLGIGLGVCTDACAPACSTIGLDGGASDSASRGCVSACSASGHRSDGAGRR